jgi:hypothetical protein
MITITRIIRRRELLMFLWAGWAVTWLDGPHARHAFLATRPLVTP